MTQKSDQKQHFSLRQWLPALVSGVVVFAALSVVKSATIVGALLTAVAIVIVGFVLLRIIK